MDSGDLAGTTGLNGLIWGYRFAGEKVEPVTEAEPDPTPDAAGFAWLHINLADRRAQRWLANLAVLPRPVRELLLSHDSHQRYVVAGETLAGVLHDVEREFDQADPEVAPLRFAILPTMILTARIRPVRSAEVLRQRVHDGARPTDAAMALDFLFAAIGEVQRRVVVELDDRVQRMEDDLLANRPPPEARAFLVVRSMMARMHRALAGMRAVLHRLDDDPELSSVLQPAVDRFSRRVAQSDSELLGVQSQLRLLRDELDLQAAQRTNRTLNTLSILSALLMPATLVTGIFGMNTGGFPWAQDPHGTFYATALAFGASAATFAALWLTGRLRR